MKLLAIALFVALGAGPALAQQGATPSARPAASQAPGSEKAAPLTEGEIRKIDKDARKITIRHGAIVNLDMPPMTMVFQVSDPAMLDTVKVGDKIRFTAEKREGALTVTRLQRAG